MRPYGVVRIDSASGVSDWDKDPEGQHEEDRADIQRSRRRSPKDYGERLAAEGEICWGGMHSWRDMVDLLEEVDRPKTVGFQADMAHTLLYMLGYNAPEGRASCPKNYEWEDQGELDEALEEADRGAAPLDDRFPRRAKRRAPSKAPAPTTRPAATAWPTIRTASSTSRITPATGCATKTAS